MKIGLYGDVSQVELTCIFDDQLVLDGQAIFPNLVGSNPTFSIPNPGTYEISFTSIDPCIDPPIEQYSCYFSCRLSYY